MKTNNNLQSDAIIIMDTNDRFEDTNKLDYELKNCCIVSGWNLIKATFDRERGIEKTSILF
ncbi:MAG: hypothetical protein Satyrvirus25_13 [Satyrvirus sp.]|uniref:Uncharacterized protein n=1 Tax=Satyrvirus sp. TaxID=2487771 RepID=A0A3G5AEP8_9VIRU|nr:MAG: hypothetical protein Satyrvirus25_13 [Satyrvirus sp.]